MKIKSAIVLLAIMALIFTGSFAGAQTKANDIPIKDLPAEVQQVLNKYAEILGSESLEKCAEAFITIAGGSLVNEAGSKLGIAVPQFSLKKDFNHFRHYASPLVITRVNKTFSNGQGYGESKIKGWVYKIWIDKKNSADGMPAPISIMVPEGHATIKSPKVVGIGSL